MRYIGDKVCAQGLRSGQLLGHLIDAVNDPVEAGLIGNAPYRLDPHRKIALHDLFCRFCDPLYRPLYHQFAPQKIDRSEDHSDQNHIAKGQFGSSRDIFFRKGKPQICRHSMDKQQHTAGDRKGNHQKEDDIIIDGSQYLTEGQLFHWITAL